MRLFCAIRHATDPDRFNAGLWTANFYPALRALGCEIIESQVDLAFLSEVMDVPVPNAAGHREARALATERILEEVRAAHAKRPIDLFLSYFYNAHFEPDGFAELRRLGIPSVNFYCNSIYQFDCVAQIAAGVDYSWHAERDAKRRYIAAGARPVWVQMGADPGVYRPVACDSRTAAAVFIGQRYADRERWLTALVDADVPVAIYGAGWQAPRQESDAERVDSRRTPAPGSVSAYSALARERWAAQGPIAGTKRVVRMLKWKMQSRRSLEKLRPYAQGRSVELAQTFGRYDVVLNFSNVWSDGRPGSALIPHVRLRDFEAPMSGACYLTGYSDEIEEFYRLGFEIDAYRDETELIDKCRFYLRHPESAERLRQAGLARARRDHTWERRFEELFHKIGLTPERGDATPGLVKLAAAT